MEVAPHQERTRGGKGKLNHQQHPGIFIAQAIERGQPRQNATEKHGERPG
jgi:hypothetical protein